MQVSESHPCDARGCCHSPSEPLVCSSSMLLWLFPALLFSSSPHDIIKPQDETNQESGRETLTLNILLRLKCLSASQELGWSHDINREGGMGWLFYKSLDEQGEITASSSPQPQPLTRFQDERHTPSREGRARWGRGGIRGGLVCVCCHSQGLYLLHNRVAAGQTWRELAGEAELVRKAPVLNL